MNENEKGRWEMFETISSIAYGKHVYILKDNGRVYSELSGKTFSRDDAIREFLERQGWNW